MFFNDSVILSKEEFNFLNNSLKEYVYDLYDCEYIDSIYFTNYDLGYKHGLISVSVLVNSLCDMDSLRKKIEIINNFFKSKLNSGTAVHFSIDSLSNYHSSPSVPMDKLRIEELIESNIIFDKSGYLTNLKNQMKYYTHEYKLNVINFEPPIDDEIAFSLYMKQKNDMR